MFTHNSLNDRINYLTPQVPSSVTGYQELLRVELFLGDQPAVITVVVKQDLAIGSSVVEEPATRFV